MDKLTLAEKFVLFLVLFLVLFPVLFLFFNPFVAIGAGKRGVIMNWGKVQNYILDEGLHWRIPIAQSIKTLSVRVQKSDVKTEGASKDLQVVNLEMVVNWAIDPKKVNRVYQTVGDEKAIFDNIVAPAVAEMAKAATSQKNAEEIITKRPHLKADIDDRLDKRLANYGIILKDVSLVNLDFSKEFNQAIEAKQVAEQESKRAQFIADKAIKEAEAIVNKAKGEAEGQRLQQQTLTPELLQKQAIEKWSGTFPTYYGGGVLPFLNLK